MRYRRIMPFGVSTHIFLSGPLGAGKLDTLHAAGAETIEIFASRHHFNYADRGTVREVANWFAANPVSATMHMPIFTETEEADWSRHTEATLNLVARSKRDRIEAMDEVKRALEVAEQVPIKSCVVHLGLKEDRWSTETLDLSLTAIEHLKAFANPLGVQLLLENLQNDLATPAHLVEITRVGHFDNVGFCLDLGHAHLAQPLLPDETGYDRTNRERLREQWGEAALRDALPEAFQIFSDRLAELHVHDNNGTRDEHLWPAAAAAGKGIDWGIVRIALSQQQYILTKMLEIAYDPVLTEREISRNLSTTRKLLE